MPTSGSVEYVNPDGMHANPAFSQMVVVTGPAKTIYIGGQNAVNAAGELVGDGDVGAQTRQIFENVRLCLAAAGAGFEHVVKWTIFVVDGHSFAAGYEAAQEILPRDTPPAAITSATVAGLAFPGALAEIEVIAVVPV